MKDLDYRLLLKIPPPRRVRRSSAVRTCHVIIAITTVLASLVVIGIVSRRISQRQALLQRGEVTQASVYDKQESSKPSLRKLLFEFYVNGKRFTNDLVVSQEQLDRARMGDPVTVTYLPENPQVMLPGRVTRETVDGAKTQLVLMLFIVLGAEGIAWAVFRLIVQRDLNLMERGIAVEGEIGVITPRAVNNTLLYMTGFKYLLNGEVVIGALDLSAAQGRERKEGDGMILLIDPATPTKPRLVEDIRFAECPDILEV